MKTRRSTYRAAQVKNLIDSFYVNGEWTDRAIVEIPRGRTSRVNNLVRQLGYKVKRLPFSHLDKRARHGYSLIECTLMPKSEWRAPKKVQARRNSAPLIWQKIYPDLVKQVEGKESGDYIILDITKLALGYHDVKIDFMFVLEQVLPFILDIKIGDKVFDVVSAGSSRDGKYRAKIVVLLPGETFQHGNLALMMKEP